MKSESFKEAFERTLSFETNMADGIDGKDVSNTANDAGGQTFCGISRKMHPNWKGWPLVDELLAIGEKFKKDEELKDYLSDFYYDEFWSVLSLDRLEPNIAAYVFDTAVNCGIHYAGVMLQTALTSYSNITVDGDIGPQTLVAYANFPCKKSLLTMMRGIRAYRYVSIVNKNKSQVKFLLGWLNRTFA